MSNREVRNTSRLLATSLGISEKKVDRRMEKNNKRKRLF
jgi:hypothetical protein